MREQCLLPLLGGALVGLGAAGLLLLRGRGAGISGLLATLALGRGRERRLPAVFLAGLVAAGGLAGLLQPASVQYDLDRSIPLLGLAGVLIGLGSRLGAGCTSGHGVCGIGRGSPRSLLATVVFVSVGMGTALLSRLAAGSP